MNKIIVKSIIIMSLLSLPVLKADEIYWGGVDMPGITLKDFKENIVSDISKYRGEYHFGEWKQSPR